METTCTFLSNLNTKVFVELIDTNGEEDISINEEIRRYEMEGKCTVYGIIAYCGACEFCMQ